MRIDKLRPACSVDRGTLDKVCELAEAEVKADPEPVTSKRYRSVSWCSTDKFLLMHSWTNGDPWPGP